MTIFEMLDELQKMAKENTKLRTQLLETQTGKEPLKSFCGIAREQGFEIYPMDLINAGEEFYASMLRSTNGGGENSPKLDGEDDFYELFMAALKR